MQSIYWTGRLLSRALWNSIASYSACGAEQPHANAAVASSKRREASFVSAVCGFPKDFKRGRMRRGQFGDDAWFSAKFKAGEVIGRTEKERGKREEAGKRERKRRSMLQQLSLWFTLHEISFFLLYFLLKLTAIYSLLVWAPHVYLFQVGIHEIV